VPAPPPAAAAEQRGAEDRAPEAQRAPSAPRSLRREAAPALAAAPPRPAAPITPLAQDIERRHAAGQLSEAQKRYDPCASGGGDLRRLAWLDERTRIVKLDRERPGGWRVEEWFDEGGRLREAVVHGPGGWVRRVVVDERGAETSSDEPAGALAPDAPPPPHVRRDPQGTFFAGPGCDPPR
jgi:hypothetical protein